jgi:ABC-type antimicrobial peptide transport system permease subunit
VAGFSVGTVPDIIVNGRVVTAVSMEPKKGSVDPTLVAGRLPSADDEIALGGDTMRSIGVGIGGRVHVGGVIGDNRPNGRVRTMRVVGEMAMPAFFFSLGKPGDGAALSLGALATVEPAAAANNNGFFVRFAPDADGGAVMHAIKRRFQGASLFPRRDSEIANLGQVSSAPIVLAAIVALMAAVTLAHTLVTSIRRRRRDLAVLKTLGFLRRQVSATVAWQATTLALLAAAVGIPLGIAAGRWGWTLFADHLSVARVSVIPILAVLLVIPAALLVANAISLFPGRSAARTQPAVVLRSE